ncbi:MAG: glycosyltransferase family 2 protein [Planctomycetota bacterium]|jgi:cellulose synthase/poly-beta-1,6-N-acetylglucosamine synthase-like glycosyltransferase
MRNRIALITPAFNEASNLKRLAESILSQTLMPYVWIIVNDDSTDGTGELIDQLAMENSFIHAVHNKKNADSSHYYAGKILAFNKGYNYLVTSGVEYDFIGNLDADISLPNGYYHNIVTMFEQNEKMGVAGGSYRYAGDDAKIIWGGGYVPGSILMARKDCFEQIGGYKPLKYGAEDTLFCVEAEVNGWQVGYFPEYQVTQHRVVGSAGGWGGLRARFRQGLSDYSIGYHPLFSIAKCMKRLFAEKPFMLAGLTRYAGYLSGPFFHCREFTTPEAMTQLRKKQRLRLRKIK